MKRPVVRTRCITLSGLLMITSCNWREPGKKDCDGISCPIGWDTITVHVQDSAGNVVALDSTYIHNVRGKAILRATGAIDGNHFVLDDGFNKDLAGKTELFRFSGYLAGAEIVNAEFEITSDCCHVAKVSGPDTLTVR